MNEPDPQTFGDWLGVLFPERHVRVRSGDSERHFVFSSARQALIALGVATGLICTNIAGLLAVSAAVAQADGASRPSSVDHVHALWDDGSVAIKPTDTDAVLAAKIERRHAALALLLSEARSDPAAAAELQPAFPALTDLTATPARRINAVVDDQDRLVKATMLFAQAHARRLRDVLALTGLSQTKIAPGPAPLHGAVITAHDARDIAGELGISVGFARRVQDAATSLFDLRDLRDTTDRLPVADPVDDMRQSSGFGFRRDPINGFPHFHLGLDFPGPVGAQIRVTAPGVVVFTGARSGYGYTVEVDHGGGFWTRYAHLSVIDVGVGQHIERGDRLGGMGSTGHSTGNHLHYEVWQNGRAQDPSRFLRAGTLFEHVG